LWIQDWAGIYPTKYGQRLKWHWRPDQNRYPKLDEYIQHLNAQNIKVLAYINPFWLAEGEAPEGILLDPKTRKPIVLKAGGFDAWHFNLAHGRNNFVENLIADMCKLGFSGWMADFGEWYPPGDDLQRYEQVMMPRLNVHNATPVDWQQLNRKVISQRKDSSDLVFFSRSGYLGVARYGSIFWAGDQMTDFGEQDGMPSAVRAMLSSGMSGIAINHSDIGGYTNVNKGPVHINRDAYLLKRWAEFAAFTPIFRSHEGLSPNANVQPWDNEDVLAHFIKMAKIHAALKSYLINLNQEAHEKGRPMIRHLWLHHPDDPETYGLDRQYLLGRDILVAPFMRKAEGEQAPKLKVYFPKGKWKHLLQPDLSLQGPAWQEVEVPIGKPAAFIRADSPWAEQLCEAMAEIKD
jgi:alpha-glucosidase